MNKVLIVEDDQEIVDLLTIHLKDLSCEVHYALDGFEGYKKALDEDYNLIILDLTLPNMDGLEICQKVRAAKNVPILMLTAKSEEIDRIIGLEMGADDYITKPFSVREFIARVKAIFRRTKMTKDDVSSTTTSIMKFQGLTIDVEKHKVLLNEEKVDLSPKEFELLVLMASNPGKNYSRPELLRLIWGYDFDGYEHTVNSHINRLRAKIEKDMAKPQYIVTSWGVGYAFNEEMAHF